MYFPLFLDWWTNLNFKSELPFSDWPAVSLCGGAFMPTLAWIQLFWSDLRVKYCYCCQSIRLQEVLNFWSVCVLECLVDSDKSGFYFQQLKSMTLADPHQELLTASIDADEFRTETIISHLYPWWVDKFRVQCTYI